MQQRQVPQRRRHQRHLLRRQPGAPHGATRCARNWTDTNGNRIVDCDLMNFTPNGECGAFVRSGAGVNVPDRRHAAVRQDPLGARRRWHAGRSGDHAVRPHRDGHSGGGQGLLRRSTASRSSTDGGGAARNGSSDLGIQHEILPRLSGEFTYNRRNYSNITVVRQLNIGCDRFNGAQDVRTCQDAMLNYTNPSYDFYTVMAPIDPRLPNGGGYRILGLNTEKTTLPAGQPIAQTLHERATTTRGTASTPTSSGAGRRGSACRRHQHRPHAARHLLRDGGRAERARTRRRRVPRRLRHADAVPDHAQGLGRLHHSEGGRARQHGVPVAARRRADGDRSPTARTRCIWNPRAPAAPREPCAVAANGVGCLGATRNTTTVPVQLLLNNEFYGERVDDVRPEGREEHPLRAASG